MVAGIVTALVGFTSSFAVVLAGLRAVGADPAQAASGLLALTLAVGLGVLVLAWRSKVPVTLAWSTPGAALLAASGMPDGGWPAAVGGFIAAGVLLALTGLVPALGRVMAKIPSSLAQAMLAGVLLQLCLAPFKALGTVPVFVAPVILCWLVMMKFAPRWAVPAALLVALAVIGVSLASAGTSVDSGALMPALTWTTPAFSLQAMAGIALPLFVVTMASQNVPGVAVLRSFGYETPWQPAMLVTGAGTVAAAPFGGHAINLAALSAALAAGDEAGADRSRRWVAGFTSGLPGAGRLLHRPGLRGEPGAGGNARSRGGSGPAGHAGVSRVCRAGGPGGPHRARRHLFDGSFGPGLCGHWFSILGTPGRPGGPGNSGQAAETGTQRR